MKKIYLIPVLVILIFAIIIKPMITPPNKSSPILNLTRLTIKILNNTYHPKAKLNCVVEVCEISDLQNLSRQPYINLYNQLYNDKSLESFGWKFVDNRGSSDTIFQANYTYQLKNKTANLTKTVTVPPATLLNQPDSPKTTAPFQAIYQIK